jgi:hypothetical protein
MIIDVVWGRKAAKFENVSLASRPQDRDRPNTMAEYFFYFLVSQYF